MFKLAVSEGIHDKRVIDYLKSQKELQEHEDFIRTPDGLGYVNYDFPGMDEDNFRYIATQLKRNGVNLDLVDSQLTEKKIMKLADLITEWSEGHTNTSSTEDRPQLFPPGGNGFVDLVHALEKTIDSWKNKYTTGYYTDEKNRADEYNLDLKELLAIYKDKVPKEKENTMSNYDEKTLSEQKVRKLIRKSLRK